MLKKMQKFNIFNKCVKKILFFELIVMVVLLNGCSITKDSLVVKTEYKDVYVPIRCGVDMPQKPKFNKYEPKTAVDITNYYLLVEEALKGCNGE